MNRIRIKNYAKMGNKRAKLALRNAERFDELLTSILIGNNIANIFSSSLSTLIAIELWGQTGVAYATIATTVIVIIFGEILPKSYAKENSENLALKTGPILRVLMTIFFPFAWLLTKFKSFLARLNQKDNNAPAVTEQELKYIIEEIEDQGVLEEQESDLVQSALDFDEIAVQEIITPRVDVVALDIEDTQEEILKVIKEEQYSRLPVYKDTIDHIVGIVKSSDYLLQVMEKGRVNLQDILSECIFVHRTKKISAVLTEFKKKKVIMAVVTDDYGGTMGIVTMEDILEQLVGEIWDETDEIINEFEKKDESTFEVNGDMNLDEMCEQLGFAEDHFKSDFNTVGGWVLETFAHIPVAGEHFMIDGITVTVLSVDEQRVKKVRITKETVGKD